jgi:putative membrane protein
MPTMVASKSQFALPVALAVVFGGCGRGQPANSPDSVEAASPPRLSAGVAPASPGTDFTSTEPGAAPVTSAAQPASAPPPVATVDSTPPLTDAQILHVLHSANASQIAQAKLAVAKAKDARVRKLAAMLIDDQTKADAKGAAVARKAGLTPEASPVSSSLDSDAGQSTSALEAESGVDFDRAYVGTQVKQHKAELALIDGQLIPNARNSDLVTLLKTVRPSIELHFQRALELQSAMQN